MPASDHAERVPMARANPPSARAGSLAYHWGMTRTQTMVQLTDELVELLDAEAARRGVSRSAVIREAILEHVAASHDAVITRSIVEGYRRLPPATPDQWGDLEAHQDQATAELLSRLDVEERAAGRQPW